MMARINSSLIKKIVIICSIVYSIFLVNYHLDIITNSHVLGYREAAPLTSTKLLLDGKNPYLLKFQPQNTNVYGIVYNWVNLPLAYLKGISLLNHRIVTAVFIFLGTVVLFLWLREIDPNSLVPVYLALIYYCLNLFGTIPIVKPDSVGSFFFLLSLYIPYRYRYSPGSILFSLLFTLLAFYTKSYFLLSFGYLLVYIFLFISKLRAIIYAAYFIFFLVVSMALIQFFYPLYLFETFLLHVNTAGKHVEYMIKQWADFVLLLPGIFIVIIFGMMKLRKKRNPLPLLLDKISIKPVKEPFCKVAVHEAFSHTFFAFLIISVLMGGHRGNYLAYHIQLFAPFLLLAYCYITSRAVFNTHLFHLVLITVFLTSTLHMWQTKLYDQRKEWQTLYKYISPDQKILNSPLVTHKCLDRGVDVLDNGQTEYFYCVTCGKVGNWISKFFSIADSVNIVSENYHNNIIQKLEKEEFDVIMLNNNSNLIQRLNATKNYQIVDSVQIILPQTLQKWNISLFKKTKRIVYEKE